MNQDIRWIQRYSNYSNALKELQSAVTLANRRELSKLEKQGVIQCFEYTYELAWKTLKDYIVGELGVEAYGSKDTFREAFKLGLLSDGKIWLEMVKSRNLTSHIYDETVAEQISNTIIADFYRCFIELDNLFLRLKKKSES